MATLQIGIAGAGLMGRWHATYARRARGQLVALMDRDLARARRLAGTLRATPGLFEDVDSMLAATRLDVLHICTPLESHYPIAMRALEAGVHVLVEKPVAASVAQTQALLETARARGLLLCPVHQFGFQKGVFAAIAALDTLGELLQVRFTTASAGGAGRAAAALDGIVAEIIPHPLSVLQRLRPGVSLATEAWQGVHARAGELQLGGTVDGIGIDFYISMNARPTRCEMELFCSEGRICLNFFHGYALLERGPATRRQKLTQPFKHAWQELRVAGVNITRRALARELAYPGLSRLIEGCYGAIATGAAQPVPAADILGVAQACEALTRRFLLPTAGQRPPDGGAAVAAHDTHRRGVWQE